MKNRSTTLIIIFSCLFQSLVYCQDFTEGFSYLNNGEYNNAETFFTKAIQEFPDNKTAHICYGRAIGLNGKAIEAKNVFTKLVKQDPTDKESLLNLAESYLWNKETKEAIKLYKELNSNYPKETLIVKSLANAHALDYQYDLAFDYAIDCLKLDQSNPNSKETYRNIGLAYAHDLKTNKQYSESKDILEKLEQLFPNDKGIITSMAYAHLVDKQYSLAELEFNKLQELDLDPIRSLIGLASISLQTGKHKQSIKYLQNDLLADSNLTEAQKIEKWDLLFGNYLTVNPSKSKEVLSNLKNHLSPSQFAEKQIYLQLELEDFKGIENQISQITDPTTKQNIILRVALESNDFKSFDSILSNIDYQVADSYTHSLMNNIQSKQGHRLTSKIELAKDNGNNVSNVVDIFYESGAAQTISPFARVQSRWLHNSQLNLGRSNHSILTVGSHIHLNSNSNLKLGIGFETIDMPENSILIIPNYDISYRRQFTKRHFSRIFSFKKRLNYNQDLLSESINKYNFGIEHHIASRSGFGSYTQANVILLTDQNIGYDLFNSLYINLKNNPILQTGINSTFLSYTENKAEYFSPKSLFSASPFIKITNEYSPNTNFKYSLMSSIGQQIELHNSAANQLIYTIQLKAGYQLSQQLYSEFFYTYANNSSAINNGFSTYYTGINLNYSFK